MLRAMPSMRLLHSDDWGNTAPAQWAPGERGVPDKGLGLRRTCPPGFWLTHNPLSVLTEVS